MAFLAPAVPYIAAAATTWALSEVFSSDNSTALDASGAYKWGTTQTPQQKQKYEEMLNYFGEKAKAWDKPTSVGVPNQAHFAMNILPNQLFDKNFAPPSGMGGFGMGPFNPGAGGQMRPGPSPWGNAPPMGKGGPMRR